LSQDFREHSRSFEASHQRRCASLHQVRICR